MRKDSEQFEFAEKRVSHWRDAFRWMLLVCGVAVFGGIIYFGYQHKASSQYFQMVNAYLNRFSTWVAERKHHLHDGLVKVKQLAVNKNNAEQEIHFEFYTALPNMQVSVSEPKSDVIDVKTKTMKKSSLTKSMAVNKPVISVDEIEKELETQINNKK